MKVVLHGTAAGPNGVLKQGDTIDLPKEAAEHLIHTGQAETPKEKILREKAAEGSGAPST